MSPESHSQVLLGFERLWRADLDGALAELGSGGQRLVSQYRALMRGPLKPDLQPAGALECTLRLHQALGAMHPVDFPHPGDQNGNENGWQGVANSLWSFLKREPFHPAVLSQDLAALRIEQLVLRSMSAFHGADEPAAIDAARLAVRQAYVEALPIQEILAYWWLGRLRRYTGKPTAAARIAGAVARVSPVGFRALLDWELALSGGDPDVLGRPAIGPAASIFRLRQAAEFGSAEQLKSHLTAVAALTLPTPFALERDRLLSGFESFDVPEDASVERSLLAFFVESAERNKSTPVVLRARPGAASRRQWFLAPEDRSELPVAVDAGERLQRCLAVLLGAGPAGLPEPELFLRVYGFAYDGARHDPMLRVLMHRLNSTLHGAGQVSRAGGVASLVVLEPFVCPDPFTAPSIEERLLRLIALQPGVGARQLAEHSGLGLRTVQRTLRLMGETGVCETVTEGRRVSYRVEDTTFHEPTDFEGRLAWES